jgi:hypothetical protein
VIRAGGRNRRHGVAVDHLLSPRALHVDDRALAGDRDRLLQCTDAQFHADRRRERARQLDSFAPDRRKSGELKRHGIDPGRQIDDAVLAVPIGDGASDLLDQYRTRGFDRDAGQHGSG